LKAKDFSKGSVIGHIVKLAIPMMLAQFINVLYNIVDRIYIGRAGENASDALTGLGICLPIITAVMAFTNLISSGGAPLFSISRGKGDIKESKYLMNNSFLMLVIIGIILTVSVHFLKIPLLKLLGASESTLPFADGYLSVYNIGTIFVMLSLGMNSFINAQGFAKTGMCTVLIGAGINIILDPIFIFYMNMGVKGAAAATVVSQAIAAVWTMLFLTAGKSDIKIEAAFMKLGLKRIIRISSLGTSGFVMAATNSAVSMVCNSQLAVWGGDSYIAVMTIINSVREVVQMPVMGMTNAIQPVIGFNYGAKLYDRVKTAIKDSAVILICYTMLMWTAVILLGRFFIGLFTTDAEIINIGLTPMHIYFFGFVCMALQFTGQSTFVGLGKTKQAIIFSLLRKVIIVIPLTILLPVWFGVNGVFMAEPVSNVLGGAACFITMIITVYKKL